MHKSITTTILFFAICQITFAQNQARFTQYTAVPTLLNPAVTGSGDELAATFLHRNQWTGITGGPESNVLSIHGPLMSQKMGLGASLTTHNAGPGELQEFSIRYAYRVRIGTGSLGLGFAFGSRTYWLALTSDDYRDPGEILNNGGKYRSGALDVGLRYATQQWYIDAAIRRADESTLDIVADLDSVYRDRSAFDPILFLAAGYHHSLNDQLTITPQMMYTHDRGQVGWWEVSGTLNYNETFWIGLGWMRNNGMAFNLQYQLRKRLRLGYSFDQGFRSSTAAFGPSHELFMKINVNWFKSKVESPRQDL